MTRAGARRAEGRSEETGRTWAATVVCRGTEAYAMLRSGMCLTVTDLRRRMSLWRSTKIVVLVEHVGVARGFEMSA